MTISGFQFDNWSHEDLSLLLMATAGLFHLTLAVLGSVVMRPAYIDLPTGVKSQRLTQDLWSSGCC